MLTNHAPVAVLPAGARDAIAGFRDRHRVPGVVVVLFDDTGSGETVAVGTPSADMPEARLDADTLAPVYSLTKMITAALVADLAAAGRLDLDAPITAILPRLQLRGIDPDAVTLTDLLSHVSGLPPDWVAPSGSRNPGDLEDEVLAAAARMPAIDRPGRMYAYSNIGFSLAGLAAQHAGRKPFADLVAANVTGPLGMRHTTHDPAEAMTYPLMQHHDGYGSVLHTPKAAVRHQPAGLCWSTASDLARLGAAHLRAYPEARHRRARPGPAGLAATHHPIGDVPGRFGLATGLGTMLTERGGHAAVAHEGFHPGMWCGLVALPAAGIGLVWLDNRGPELRTARWPVIEGILGHLGVPPPDPRPATGPVIAATEVSGRYGRFGAQPVQVSMEGDAIVVTAAGRRDRLYRTAADTWASPEPVADPTDPPWVPHMTSVHHVLGAHADAASGVHAIHLNGLPYRREPS